MIVKSLGAKSRQKLSTFTTEVKFPLSYASQGESLFYMEQLTKSVIYTEKVFLSASSMVSVSNGSLWISRFVRECSRCG